jgi:ABC-type branched-subunit amino acid transport system permease subunit
LPSARSSCLLLALPLLLAAAGGQPLHVSAYTLTLVGKILCYAIVALALDLVWGYAGCCPSATACSSPSAATRWACT